MLVYWLMLGYFAVGSMLEEIRLKATAADALVPNPHVATAFSGGQPVYQTFTAAGVELPYVWQFDVGKSDS